MSDVGLGATLQLDIAEALGRIDQLAAQIGQVTTDIPTSLGEPDATPITSAIDQAVAAADTTVTPDAEADGITGAIDAAVDAADTTVPVDADTTAAEEQIGGISGSEVTVDVGADTAAAEAELGALADQVESTDATITVTADTAQAEADIESLADTAATASTGLGQLAGSGDQVRDSVGAAGAEVATLAGGVKALQVVQTTAAGSAAGLASAVGGVSTGSLAAVGAVGAVVASLDSFFQAGVKVVASKDRFKSTFGDLADGIKDVDVGTLNGDLSDLALQLGTSTSGLRNAASGIGQFGEANGTAADEVARTAEQILALSLRARALNPSLGESGDIAQTLAGALARGGRALGQFGIALTAAEINARALRDTGKSTNTELTQFDKLSAGAAIAAERLGGTLGSIVADGADKAQIQLARMQVEFARLKSEIGEPLVEPITEFLTNLVPIGLAAGAILGAVVAAITPMIEVLGAALGPIGRFVSGIVDSIDPALIGLVGGLVAAAAGIGAFVTAITAGIAVANPILAGFLAVVGLAATASSLFKLGDADQKANQEKFTAGVKSATQALDDQRGGLNLTQHAIVEYLKTSSAFATSTDGQIAKLAEFGITLDDVAKFAREGVPGLEAFQDRLIAILEADPSVTEETLAGLRKSLETTQATLQATARATLDAGVANGELDKSYQDSAKETRDYVKALDQAQAAQDATAHATLIALVATDQITAAQRDAAIESTKATDGTLNYSAALQQVNADAAAAAERQAALNESVAQLGDGYNSVLNALSGFTNGTADADRSLLLLAQQLERTGAGAEEFQTVADVLGVSVEQLHTFVDGANAAVKSFVDDAVGKIPTLGTAFDLARERAEAAERKLTGKDIVAGLNETLKQIEDYGKNLQTILGSTYSDLAGFAASAGPDVVAAIANSLNDKDFKTLNAIRTGLVDSIPTAYGEAVEAVNAAAPGFIAANGTVGVLAKDSFGLGYDINAPTQAAFEAAQAQVVQASPLLSALTGEAGTSATASYQKGLQLAGVSVGDITSAGRGIAEKSPLLSALTAGLGASMTTDYEKNLGLPGSTQTNVGQVGAEFSQQKMLSLGNYASAGGFYVGTQFSTGLVQGIAAQSPAVSNATRHVVERAEAAAKDAAGIKSPSTLFAEIGRNMVLGMSIGMTDATGSVVAAAESITRAAAGAASGSAASAVKHAVELMDLYRRIAEIEGTSAEDIRLGGGGHATPKSRALRREMEKLQSGIRDRPGAPPDDDSFESNSYYDKNRNKPGYVQAEDGSWVPTSFYAKSYSPAAPVTPSSTKGAAVWIDQIDVRIEITGDITDAEANRVGAAAVDGMTEQLDRKFAADFRLARTVGG